MATESETTNNNNLTGKWQIEERPFTSSTPVIGSLIVRFRQFWNNISTTWYVRPLVQQQNEINQELVHLLVIVQRLAQTSEELSNRLISADHDQTDLARQLAELTYAVNNMNHRLAKIEAALDTQSSSQEPQA